MTRVILDTQLRKKLKNLNRRMEFCDEAGHVLGHFVPAEPPIDPKLREPQVSEQELKRRARSKEKRYTTAEVLAYLEKL